MAKISSIVRDTAGRLTFWVEGDYSVTVSRDAAGKPLFLRAKRIGENDEVVEFQYSAAGAFSGQKGDFDSALMFEIQRSAAMGGAVPVGAKTDILTGGIKLSSGGDNDSFDLLYDDTPLLLIGGDHPYQQWWGTTGGNGMAAMHNAAGITPYVAVNTAGPNAPEYDPSDLMTWAQIDAINGNVEIVGHAHRHPQEWTKLNTGITVTYTGAAATATVAITATTIAGLTAGGVADFAFTFATEGYATLALVAASIAGVAGWSCNLAEELTGSEASANLLPRPATSAKTTPLHIAAGGGFRINNTGTTYKAVELGCDSTTIFLFADGVRLYSAAFTSTYTTVVNAINALGAGITAAICNDTPASGTNYMSGSETLGNSHLWNGLRQVHPEGIACDAGLSHWYIAERQMQKNIDVAATHGVALTHFAQSGGSFFNDEMHGHPFRSYRGDPRDSAYPCAFFPSSKFHPHATVTGAAISDPYYGSARCLAILEALVDSPGYAVNLLMHKLQADGSSGYSLPTAHATYYDQPETVWEDFLAAAKTYIDNGRIKPVTAEKLRRYTSIKRGLPANLLFNPNFKNSGETLTGLSADSGGVCPGWKMETASGFTSIAIADGYITAVVNTGATLVPVKQMVHIPPGTYEIGFECLNMVKTGGSGVQAIISASNSLFWNQIGFTGASTIGANPLRTKGSFRRRFTVSPPKAAPARIISKNAQTWNLTTNKAIKLTVNGGTAIDNLDCSAGATSAAAVTAKEVAAAINAAIATAAWGAEYHNMASAVAGKVVLTNPYLGSAYTDIIKVETAMANDACTTIFGSASNQAGTRYVENEWPGYLPVAIQFSVALANTDTVTFGKPYLRQINDFI